MLFSTTLWQPAHNRTHALGEAGGASAEVIMGCFLDNQARPARLSSDHLAMSCFLVLQALRTTWAADALNETSDKRFKAVYRN